MGDYQKKTTSLEYYVIIDEFADYITPDIRDILNQASKWGLHLILIHHNKDQIKEISGAMESAQTKIEFSIGDDLKGERQFTFRRYNGETFSMQSPEVGDTYLSDEQFDSYLQELTQDFLTIAEVDSLLCTTHNEEDELKDEDFFR